MKKPALIISSIVAIVLLFVVGNYLYTTQQEKKIGFLAQDNASVFIREHSQTLGSNDAKVYLVEFLDPACETCSAFHSIVKNIMESYPGKIKLVVRYAPFHDGADYFVKILEAARRQGKYWETLEAMYRSQHYWASHHHPQPQLVWQFLGGVGLDLEKVKVDMNDPAIARLIEQDLADAKTLDVRKTPGYFVNGKPLITFGEQQLRELVAAEIQAAY